MAVTLGTAINLVLRLVKGSELTHQELDNNQYQLKTAIESHGHTTEHTHLNSTSLAKIEEAEVTGDPTWNGEEWPGKATTGVVGGLIAGAAVKATPVDADNIGYSDSEATNTLKRFTWANCKATLKAYFDTIYAPTAKGVTNGDTHNHSNNDGGQIGYGSLSGVPSTFPPSTHTHAYQPVDDDLSALAAIDTVGIIRRTGPATFTVVAVEDIWGLLSCVDPADGKRVRPVVGDRAIYFEEVV